jgi:hypothetical protein
MRKNADHCAAITAPAAHFNAHHRHRWFSVSGRRRGPAPKKCHLAEEHLCRFHHPIAGGPNLALSDFRAAQLSLRFQELN